MQVHAGPEVDHSPSHTAHLGEFKRAGITQKVFLYPELNQKSVLGRPEASLQILVN